MTVNITKLKVKKNKRSKKNTYFRNSWYELDLEFEIEDGKEYYDNFSTYFDPLLEFYETIRMDDIEGYKKEINKIVKGKDWVKALNDGTFTRKHTWQKATVTGMDMITKTKKSKKVFKFKFHEYFTATRVTLAIINELRAMKRNPKHSHKTIPEQYLAHLLISLAYFWD